MDGVITFRLGGAERTVKVSLGLVPEIEKVTGTGIIQLAYDAKAFRLKLSDAVAIIGVAMKASGAARTPEQLYDMVQVEGVVEHMTTALIILNKFFEVPEGVAVAAPGNRKGKKPAAVASH